MIFLTNENLNQTKPIAFCVALNLFNSYNLIRILFNPYYDENFLSNPDFYELDRL